MNPSTTGRNVIVEPIETNHDTLTLKGKVLAVGEQVLSVSQGNIISYDGTNVSLSAVGKLPYVIIHETDIFEIKEA